MSDYKMRAEFEEWAKAEGYSLRKYTQAEFEAFAKADGLDVLRWLDFSSSYIDSETTAAEHGYEAGYQTGRKAEQAEVERLRAELAELRQKRCDENSEIELQALRVLDSSEVDGDSDSVPPTVLELVELMADTAVMAREERNLWHSAAQRLKAELAAAKAASVCPVNLRIYLGTGPSEDCYIRCQTLEDGIKFREWLRSCMK